MSQKITKIEKQIRRDRYNIYLDGKYSFSLASKVLADLYLKKDDEPTAEEIEEAKGKDDEHKVFERALCILSYRAHSHKEILDKLARKFGGYLAEKAVTKLEALKLVDDDDFAREYVRRSRKGKKLIRLELMKKGISKEVAVEALEEKASGEELENAMVLAEKIMNRHQGKDSMIVKKKIYEGLVRRGFSYDIYKDVISELDIG